MKSELQIRRKIARLEKLQNTTTDEIIKIELDMQIQMLKWVI